MTDAKPPEGLVAGKYRLTRLLGKGGMGTVWEGVHESLGTRVAVKFIDAEYASSDEIRQRFVNEAKAAARLRSKHVVQVYDQGVGGDGRPYIVMEFLAGEPLDRRLDRLGRLSAGETGRIVLHVCRALAKAHEAGIVHRDLKPENIFLVRDDEDQTDLAKVVDFGIAKFTDPSGGTGSSSTRTGAVLGTPQFMSPEQARGLRSVDRRTDLWSLGVIAYRCLAGVLPFKGEAMGDLLVNICTSEAPPPSSIAADVPPGFDAWMRRALAREPADRFQTASQLADSLAAVCGLDARLGPSAGTQVTESQPEPTPAGSSPDEITAAPLTTTHVASLRSRRSLWAVLGLVFLAVGAGAVVVARGALRTDPEPPPSSAADAPRAPAANGDGPAADPSAKVPEVTPITSGAPPAVSAAAPKDEVEAAKSGVAARAGSARAQRPPGSPRPPPAPARGQSTKRNRPADELGY